MENKLISILFSLLLTITVPTVQAAEPSQMQSPEISGNGFNLPDFSPIYDSVGKAVVNINVTHVVQNHGGAMSGDPMLDFFLNRMVPPQQQRQRKSKGLGSGFIISNDGYVLTNAHVVAKATGVTVKLSDKREFKAKVVGIDPETDVAILKIDAKQLPVVKIGDPNKMKPGNWVLAIGSPFGLENTITHGIISALSRDISDDKYVPFIQTDVPINPGNSGGPLINLKGEVIGVNAQIYSKSGGYMGISFAIPIDYAMKVAEQLKATGKVNRGRLGVAIQTVTDELAKSFSLPTKKGALVNSVEPNSAAAKAGIEVGDVILKVDGSEIIDSGQLPRIIGQAGVNKKINLQLWRNGKSLNLVAVTQAAKPEVHEEKVANSNPEHNKSIGKLGIMVSEVTDTKRLPQGVKYALIVQEANDHAGSAGVQPGDLIIGVGNRQIKSLADFTAIINLAKTNNVVALKIIRSGGMGQAFGLFVPVPIIADEK
jgi:serine protease Do